jgi:hypothetical protein
MTELDFRKAMKYVASIESSTMKLQDADGRWYWIPKELTDVFLKNLNTAIQENDFKFFNKIYGGYRTNGSAGEMPDYYLPQLT